MSAQGATASNGTCPVSDVSCICSSMSWVHSLARSSPLGERKACSLPGPGKQTCNNLVVDSQPIEHRPEKASPVVRLGRLQSHARRTHCGPRVLPDHHTILHGRAIE